MFSLSVGRLEKLPGANHMDGMRQEYREIIEKTLCGFVRNGDDVMCVAVFAVQDRTCEVCGYRPITWNYLIENLATHEPLIAGSECVRNYETVLRNWGYAPAFVVYPTYFARFTRWLTGEEQGNPNAVQIHDRFLDRIKVDAPSYLGSKIPEVKSASVFEYVRVKAEPQPQVAQVQVETSYTCPRCANGGKYYCDVCGPRGIALKSFQARRLCGLCQAVVRCPTCGDKPEIPGEDEIPF